MDLQRPCNEESHLSVSIGWYLLGCRDGKDHTGCNGFEVCASGNRGSAMLVSGIGSVFSLVYPASHTHIHYLTSGKQKLAELLHVEEMRIPSMFSSDMGTSNVEYVAIVVFMA